MVHNLIAAAVLAALAGLWWYSGIVARLNRGDTALLARADAQPAETEQVPPWRAAPWVTGTGEHPTIGTQPVCGCGGRRCRAHREGADCLTAALAERPAYWRRIPAGRHTTGLAVARWLAGDWWQADLPVRLRRELGRLAGAGTIPAGVS